VKVKLISGERLLAAAASVPPETCVLVIAWHAGMHTCMPHLQLLCYVFAAMCGSAGLQSTASSSCCPAGLLASALTCVRCLPPHSGCRLTAEERSRNIPGDMLVFEYAAGRHEPEHCASDLPQHFASVAMAHSICRHVPVSSVLPPVGCFICRYNKLSLQVLQLLVSSTATVAAVHERSCRALLGVLIRASCTRVVFRAASKLP
jgi:hypothetical protein